MCFAWDARLAKHSKKREWACTKTRKSPRHMPRWERKSFFSWHLSKEIFVQIEIKNGQAFLIDAESTNGTALNGWVFWRKPSIITLSADFNYVETERKSPHWRLSDWRKVTSLPWAPPNSPSVWSRSIKKTSTPMRRGKISTGEPRRRISVVSKLYWNTKDNSNHKLIKHNYWVYSFHFYFWIRSRMSNSFQPVVFHFQAFILFEVFSRQPTHVPKSNRRNDKKRN